jgi:hypothetical protein
MPVLRTASQLTRALKSLVLCSVACSGCLIRPGNADATADTDPTVDSDTEATHPDSSPPDTDWTPSCPPPTDFVGGATEDGRPIVAMGDDVASIDQALVWLACCEPSRFQTAVAFGGWRVDVFGSTDGACVVGIRAFTEGYGGDWTCRFPEPVQVWPEFHSKIDAPDPRSHPECSPVP